MEKPAPNPLKKESKFVRDSIHLGEHFPLRIPSEGWRDDLVTQSFLLAALAEDSGSISRIHQVPHSCQ